MVIWHKYRLQKINFWHLYLKKIILNICWLNLTATIFYLFIKFEQSYHRFWYMILDREGNNFDIKIKRYYKSIYYLKIQISIPRITSFMYEENIYLWVSTPYRRIPEATEIGTWIKCAKFKKLLAIYTGPSTSYLLIKILILYMSYLYKFIYDTNSFSNII